MKQIFLETLADELDDSPGGWADTTVVLPTKRAGVHLRKILAARADSARLLPRITTINEWMAEVSGLHPADALKNLFTGYEAYREVLGPTAQGISEYMAWAPVMLADFNAMDAGLIPAKNLFRDLVDYTEIEHFSFLDAPLTQSQENYRKFWKSLPKIHGKLVEKLTSEGLGYPGLSGRLAVDRLEEYLRANPGAHFLFAGLNALTAAEEKLLSHLQKVGRGRILFEADTFYLDPKDHHAGLFIRRYRNSGLGKLILTEEPLNKREFHVSICSANNKLDQANAVAALLRDNPFPMEDTAVILADESLVIPILQRLPRNVESVNVTMGLPLAGTSFFDWFEHWFVLHQTAKRVEKGDDLAFQQRTLADFLEHPFTQSMERGVTLPPSRSYVSLRQIRLKNPALTAALNPVENEKGLDFNALKSTLKQVMEHCLDSGDSSPESRAGALGAKRAMDTVSRLETYAEAKNIGIRGLRSVLLRAVSSGSLSLVGEPLGGLQIMGVLESRGLSFKRVILCSAEEAFLPGNSAGDSFIPFEIRNHYRMPGRREKESVYAYQFYRLLQRAERFDAIYQTDTEGMSSGEKSRYLLQLEYDLAKVNQGITLEHLTTPMGMPDTEVPNTELEKNPDVLAKITQYLTERPLSASSINRYLDSPLEWYYGNVLNLEEPDEADLSPATFGTIVHETLENLYKEVEGQVLKVSNLDAMQAKVAGVLNAVARAEVPGRDFNRGVDHIHLRTALKMLQEFLKKEKEEVEKTGVEIVYLQGEKKLDRSLNLEVNGGKMTLNFTGKTDRLERRNGQLRVIDYKTGSVEQKELKCNLLDRENLEKKPKALQLLMYEWLCEEAYAVQEVASGIISLPALGRNNLVLDIDNPDKYRTFEEILAEIVREMLDPAIPITANPDFKYPVFEVDAGSREQ